jgi:hypothetical protein
VRLAACFLSCESNFQSIIAVSNYSRSLVTSLALQRRPPKSTRKARACSRCEMRAPLASLVEDMFPHIPTPFNSRRSLLRSQVSNDFPMSSESSSSSCVRGGIYPTNVLSISSPHHPFSRGPARSRSGADISFLPPGCGSETLSPLGRLAVCG